MLGWLRKLTAKWLPNKVRMIRAKFDAAQTTDENRRHWANADTLSADAAANPAVRRVLRNRARYEIANNSYAHGIVLTLANDVIGTGPRLQMLLGDGADSGDNQTIEREFAAWAKAVDLPAKLRTMRMARDQDGESFALLVNNDSLPGAVKLDIRLVEADQVATPDLNPSAATNAIDGIDFDSFGKLDKSPQLRLPVFNNQLKVPNFCFLARNDLIDASIMTYELNFKEPFPLGWYFCGV